MVGTRPRMPAEWIIRSRHGEEVRIVVRVWEIEETRDWMEVVQEKSTRNLMSIVAEGEDGWSIGIGLMSAAKIKWFGC